MNRREFALGVRAILEKLHRNRLSIGTSRVEPRELFSARDRCHAAPTFDAAATRLDVRINFMP